MKRFAFTLVVLACLPAAGLAAQPDSETVAAERQIRQKLNQPAGIEFVVTPLRERRPESEKPAPNRHPARPAGVQGSGRRRIDACDVYFPAKRAPP